MKMDRGIYIDRRRNVEYGLKFSIAKAKWRVKLQQAFDGRSKTLSFAYNKPMVLFLNIRGRWRRYDRKMDFVHPFLSSLFCVKVT